MGERTKTDWLGREKMGARMTGVTPQQVEAAVAAAQESWNAGRLAHVYKPAAMAVFEADGLTEAVDAILRIGWQLHSTAIGGSTVGMNMQHAMFVFTRPPSQD